MKSLPLRLVIGPKNYSSWSMRPWLVLKAAGLPFEAIPIRFDSPTADEEIRRYSPTGKVPVLLHGDEILWESLAICEYVHDLAPDARLWPEDRVARGHARSVSTEMYARFDRLREGMPMNIRARKPGKGRSPGVMEEIERICALWRECRQRFGGDGEMLFGHFTIADAMYAPVVFRFLTYGVELGPIERRYVEAVESLPDVQEWVEAARIEPERIEAYEL